MEVMKKMPPQSVDMILCDLPYGITQNKWDSILPLGDYVPSECGFLYKEDFLLREFKAGVAYSDALRNWNASALPGLWSLYKRVLKPNGVIVLTSNELFTSQLIDSNPDDFKYRWVWVKSKATNFLNAKIQPLRKFEDVCVFYGKQPTYHPQMTEGEAYDKGVRKDQLTGSYGDFKPRHVVSDGQRYPTDVVYFKTAEAEGPVIHSTQKPVELGRYFVRTYTNPGDVVLDNTCGSGSFLVSALLEGRNFIGIEKSMDTVLFKKQNIDYIHVCKKRLKEAWATMSPEQQASIIRTGVFKEKESCVSNE